MCIVFSSTLNSPMLYSVRSELHLVVVLVRVCMWVDGGSIIKVLSVTSWFGEQSKCSERELKLET